VTPGRRRLLLVGLIAVVVAGLVALALHPGPDLTPLAERVLRAHEDEADTLLQETALGKAWDIVDLRTWLAHRTRLVGAFQGWAEVSPLERLEGAGAQRRRQHMKARFERAPEPLPARFDFVSRPGGWVVSDFEVLLPQPSGGPRVAERARVQAETLGRILASRRFGEVHARMDRRAKRAETLAALEARLRPRLKDLGKVEHVEVTELKEVGGTFDARLSARDEHGVAFTLHLRLVFELGEWFVQQVDVTR
jgi:hypothetical protein